MSLDRTGQLWRHRRSGGIILIARGIALPFERSLWLGFWLEDGSYASVHELELVVHPEPERSWERLA